MSIRLNKYLKDIGLCSRRKADEFIANGYIKVNNTIIYELGYKITPTVDKIEVMPVVNKIIQEYRYILLNKPCGYVCSKNVQDGKLIFELIPQIENLTYAGRLDKDSQGLIILSNDGKFVYQITGKEFACEKEYLVTVNRPITPEYLFQQASGNIRINGKQVKKAKVKKVNENTYTIVLTEGMNRQIRKMAENQGYRVTQLKRIRIGKINDTNLKIGNWRELTAIEISSLKKSTAP